MSKPFLKIAAICFLVSLAVPAAMAEDRPTVPLDLLEPPAPDKAAMYFFLPGKTPVIPSISLFDGEKQLPNLLGAREYARYEVDPGLHTFVVQGVVPAFPSTEQWVHGDLEAGGIYAALISGFLADLVIIPLTGRMDPDLLINMKIEERQWERIAGLIRAKPPKPPGKERKHRMNLDHVIGHEVIAPTYGFAELGRLNRTEEYPRAFPLDRLPEPVPGRAVVTFFVPSRRPDQHMTLFDGQHRLGPVLEGGRVYTYEVDPGVRTIWVREVGAAYTRYRLVTGKFEPGRVYAIHVHHSYGGAGARLFILTGDMGNRVSFIPEPELWHAIAGIPDGPPVALTLGGPVPADEMKPVAKRLKKKQKKQRGVLTPLK